jgi:ribosomal protein S18 acetylase RimI-like enzyme
MNIHDLAVKAEFRGQQIATALMKELEAIAKEKGCCKLTLEVLSNNKKAQQTYLRFGFVGYQLTPEAGHALFWQKKL